MQQTATRSLRQLSSHRIGDSSDILTQIVDPDVELSLWRRPIQHAVARELEILQASDLPDLRYATTPVSFGDDIAALMRRQRLDPQQFSHLRADLQRLMGCFWRVSAGRAMRFRLMTTDENDCKRFHLDRTNLRMICTYQGPGTEWLTEAQVDRDAQMRGAPNESIIRYGEPSRFKLFWVGILKGDPANVGTGLVHRSPAIEGSGKIRVVFCLDS